MKNHKIITPKRVLAGILFLLIAFTLLPRITSEKKYSQAISYLEDQNFSAAYAIFYDLGNYKQSEEYLQEIIVKPSYIDLDPYEYYYYYDNYGNLVKLVQDLISTEYSYDEEGNCVLEVRKNDEGKLISSTEFFYDTARNCVLERETWDSGNVDEVVYSYDSNNNCIERRDSPSGTISTFEYDSNNNCIKKTTLHISGVTETDEYEYDRKGNQIKYTHTTTVETGLQWETTYSYDNNGNCVKEITRYNSGKVIEDRYRYDIYGSRIESIYFYGTDTEQISRPEYVYCFFYNNTLEVHENIYSPKEQENDSEVSLFCVECGKEANCTYTNPFSNENELYCYTHYNEIIDIMSGIESDVGNSVYSNHTCEQCSREGTHRYESFTGQTEYYCTQHYEELTDMLESFGLS